jgi:hypothetical protein
LIILIILDGEYKLWSCSLYSPLQLPITSAEQETSSSKCSYWYLAGLHFNSEDGGYMFLQNVGLSLNYMALQPRRLYSLLKLNYQSIFSFD